MRECKHCNIGFEITGSDRQFYNRINVPEPTLCPDCRKRRQLAFRNERNWYKRKCDLTGESVISVYSQDKPFKIYSQKVWWGDAWNPFDYGLDFDFGRPFFPQFRTLQFAVPRVALFNTNSENCEYTVHSADNRNCYMCCDVGGSEDIYYSNWIVNGKNLVDCTRIIEGELCYECLDSDRIYSCFYCQDCKNCSESHFLYDCHDCHNCVGCTGLRNKENYLFNQPSNIRTISEYRQKLGSPAFLTDLKKKFEELKLITPRVYMHALKSENVSGEYVEESKDVLDSYHVSNARDCRFITESAEMNDCYDCHSVWRCEGLYEFHANVRATSSMFCNLCYDATDLLYCDHCFNCQNCFGCVGLNHKKYCILNRQYSKKDYEELIAKIIDCMRQTKEWGEFFPMEYSPFDYSETVANDYYPAPGIQKHITGDKQFKIVNQERAFYKRFNIPLPKFHPGERYRRRMIFRNPRKLFARDCAKCGAGIQTTYSPDRPEKVYCEYCYLKNIY